MKGRCSISRGLTWGRGACALVLVSIMAVTTAACAANEGPLGSAPGTIATPDGLQHELTVVGAPQHDVRAWAVGQALVVTTRGLASCPWVPTVAEIDAPNSRILIEVQAFGVDGPCTTAEGEATFELEIGRDVSDYVVEVAGEQS